MKVNSRGQVVIPKELMEQYDLHPGDEVEFLPLTNGVAIRKKKAVHPVDQVTGIIKLRSGKDVDDFIEQVRGR